MYKNNHSRSIFCHYHSNYDQATSSWFGPLQVIETELYNICRLLILLAESLSIDLPMQKSFSSLPKLHPKLPSSRLQLWKPPSSSLLLKKPHSAHSSRFRIRGLVLLVCAAVMLIARITLMKQAPKFSQ